MKQLSAIPHYLLNEMLKELLLLCLLKETAAIEYMASGLVSVISMWIHTPAQQSIESLIAELSEIHYQQIISLMK